MRPTRPQTKLRTTLSELPIPSATEQNAVERYANFESSPTKREFFDAVEDAVDQYEHDVIGWETLVERLLGLAEAYRKVHPIKASGVELEDNAGHWQDNL